MGTRREGRPASVPKRLAGWCALYDVCIPPRAINRGPRPLSGAHRTRYVMSRRIAPFGTLRIARVAAGLALMLGAASPAAAQTIPKRPGLPATADTNDAHAYYALGT